MHEDYNRKIEEIPSIINDIISSNCEINFVSKRTGDDPVHHGYMSEIIELSLIYPNSIDRKHQFKGAIYIYYPKKKNERSFIKEPEMRLEIKWHKGTVAIGDGKNTEYFSSVLKEISSQYRDRHPEDNKITNW